MHIELAKKREALKSAGDSELVAQEIVQRGAINALETILRRGFTRGNARAMLGSLRENLAYIEALRADKGPRPLTARYATPPPRDDLCWLETAHFLPPDNETVLMAWPRGSRFTFRTGRHNGKVWLLSDDTKPREIPVLFAPLDESK